MTENPYEAALADDGEAIQDVAGGSKPSSLIWIGITNILFAVAWLFFIVMPTMNMARETPSPSRYFRVLVLATTAIMLFASGLGLLAGRPFGRSLAICYSWLQILLVTVLVSWSFLEHWEGMIANAPFSFVGELLGGFVLILWPVVLLLVMHSRRVTRAFA